MMHASCHTREVASKVTKIRKASFKSDQTTFETLCVYKAIGDESPIKLRESHWPKLYWADITVFNNKKQQEEKASIPFLLPHEILLKLFEFGDPAFILGQAVSREDHCIRAAHAAACQPPQDPKAFFH